MKKYILPLIIAFLSVHLLAQDKNQFNPVNTGVNSLGIAPDSRGGGMGDVGAATDPDVNSQFWNPAKYPFTISRAGVAVSYTPWLRKLVNDIDLAYLAGYYRIGDYQAVSGSLRYFSLGEVPVGYTGDENSPGYTIKPYEMAVDIAYSRMLSERFSAAVALRYIYSDLAYREDEEVSAGSAFAADIAFYYTNYVILAQRECMLSFGLNASNIGTKISYDSGNTSQFLPTNLRLGASLLFPIDDYNTIGVSFDANKYMVPTRPIRGEDESQEEYEERLDLIIMISHPLRVFSNLSVMLPVVSRKNCRRYNGRWDWNIPIMNSSPFVVVTIGNMRTKETASISLSEQVSR